MLEITIAVLVFGAAMIPVLFLTTSTARRTFSMEKHLVAGQFAAGILDRLSAMTYAECRQEIAKEAYPRKVLDDPSVKTMLGSGKSPEFAEMLAKTCQDFEFEVKLTEPARAEEKDQMVGLAVHVSWPAEPGSKASRQFSLHGVKFRERP